MGTPALIVGDDDGELHFFVGRYRLVGFEPHTGGADIPNQAGPTGPPQGQFGLEPRRTAAIRNRL
jgi:hypothetical protein